MEKGEIMHKGNLGNEMDKIVDRRITEGSNNGGIKKKKVVGGKRKEVSGSLRTGILDFAKYSKNPFTERWALKMVIDSRRRETKYARRIGTVIDQDANIVEEGELLLGVERVVDKEQFVKIYIGTLMLFNQLSKRAALLFTYIIKLLQKDKTYVYLIPFELTELMGCSEATYYRSVIELLNTDMIARSRTSNIIYFINPAFIYNGNRMTLVHRFIKEKSSYDPKDDAVDNNNFMKTPYDVAMSEGEELPVIRGDKSDEDIIKANQGFSDQVVRRDDEGDEGDEGDEEE